MISTDIQKQEHHSLYQFDVLRGIAIIGVFMVHCQYAIYPDFDIPYDKFMMTWPDRPHWYKLLTMSPFAFGGMGVTLFFIISGFLIHYITLKKGTENVNWLHFFNKRFWRIYPPYLLVLLFFAFGAINFNAVVTDPMDLISHLFLFHNFINNYFFSIDGPFWSLAVEAQFYLLYPLFLFVRAKIGIGRLVWVLAGISCLGTLYWWIVYDLNDLVVGNSLVRHYVTWALGAFLAECFFNKKIILGKVSLIYVFGGFILLYVGKIFIISHATGILLADILIAIVVEKYLNSQRPITRFERLLIPLGLCSYSFYLIHNPYLRSLFDAIDLFKLSKVSTLLFWIVNTIPVFVIIYAISWFAHFQIEVPFINLGEKIYTIFLKRKQRI